MTDVTGADRNDMRRDRIAAASIGVLAFAAVDVAHEALGHGIAALLAPGVTPVAISTVALSTLGNSRMVPLAGPLLNLILGSACLALFRRVRGFGPGAFFLWLFATANLLNAFGYGVYSGVLDFGDLAVAVQGLEPHAAWRAGMAALGLVGYYATIRIAAGLLSRRLASLGTGSSQLLSLLLPAYLGGSTVLLAGAALNPIASLVLMSGLTSGFLCMTGLLAVPAVLPEEGGLPVRSVLGTATAWRVAGMIGATLFVAVMGPGIAL
jgi:hypothetical protein